MMEFTDVLDRVLKEHTIGNDRFDDDLQIAAKLGNALLLQNNEYRERNSQLWQSNEELKREVELLRQQNKILRDEADIKSSEQVQLDFKLIEMTDKIKLLEKEVLELQSLLNSMAGNMAETEKLYLEECLKAEELSEQLAQLELRQIRTPPLSPSPSTRSSTVQSPASPSLLREHKQSFNHLQNVLSRSEEKRKFLEDEVTGLLEENSELFKKLQELQSVIARPSSPISNTKEADTDTVTVYSEDTLDSFTSESWLAEKLAVLEVDENLSKVSYRELFDQLFDALESSKLITPAGTLKRRKAKSQEPIHAEPSIQPSSSGTES